MVRAMEGSEVTTAATTSWSGAQRTRRTGGATSCCSRRLRSLGRPALAGAVRRALPGAEHVALGIDATQRTRRPFGPVRGRSPHRAEHRADGRGLTEPPYPDRSADYRPLAGDEDWRSSLELRLAADDGSEAAVTRAFYQQRTVDARRLTENGDGAWFGAFDGGKLVAQLGCFPTQRHRPLPERRDPPSLAPERPGRNVGLADGAVGAG